jgi:hypothetical protein
VADILSTDEERIDAPVMGAGQSPSALAATAQKAYRGTAYSELMTGTATRVVKGAGQVVLGGDRGSTGRPFSDAEHGTEIMRRSRDTIIKSRAAAMSGAWETDDVLGGISPEFWSHPQVQNRYRPCTTRRSSPPRPARTTRPRSARTSPGPTRTRRERRTAWCRSICWLRAG